MKMIWLCLVWLLVLQTISLADRPNVLLLFTDDQGTLDAGCYGSSDLYTPTIDQLAATGVRFTQAYAHTVCCPSRALLLTGRHPQRSGITNWTQGSRKPNEGNPDRHQLAQGRNHPSGSIERRWLQDGIDWQMASWRTRRSWAARSRV